MHVFVSELHKNQNKIWHALYPEDLEHEEIVPLNAFRDEQSSYWWVPNSNNDGHSRWRSKKQLQQMHAYISSPKFEEDMTKLKTDLEEKMKELQENIDKQIKITLANPLAQMNK